MKKARPGNPEGVPGIVDNAYGAYLAGPTQVTLTTAWQRFKITGTLAGRRPTLLPVSPAMRVSIPWRTALAWPILRANLVMCFAYGYTGCIYIKWFPTYVNEERHPSTTMTGLVAGLPLALGMPAKPLGGWWSDHAVRARGLVYGRRLVGMKRAGTAPARMLTAGSLWNALSAIAFGTFLHYTGSWIPPFVIAMPANLTGAPLWLKINPGDQLT